MLLKKCDYFVRSAMKLFFFFVLKSVCHGFSFKQCQEAIDLNRSNLLQ